jgi:hypothetical protein
MVHVFCSEEICRRVIHLNDNTHWDFKGQIKCKNCGTVLELEVKQGHVIKQSKPHSSEPAVHKH